MVSLLEANLIAKKHVSKSNAHVEYEDAYLFYQKGVDNSEIVIMKKDGEVLDYDEYVEKHVIPKNRKVGK